MNKITLKRFLHDKVTFGKITLEWIPNCPDIYTIELAGGGGGIGYCITQGLYNCIPHNSADHPETWELLNVPGRTEILIHVGNYALPYIDKNGIHKPSDTKGCILVGFGINESVPMIERSEDAIAYLRNTIGINENFIIEVKD